MKEFSIVRLLLYWPKAVVSYTEFQRTTRKCGKQDQGDSHAKGRDTGTIQRLKQTLDSTVNCLDGLINVILADENKLGDKSNLEDLKKIKETTVKSGLMTKYYALLYTEFDNSFSEVPQKNWMEIYSKLGITPCLSRIMFIDSLDSMLKTIISAYVHSTCSFTSSDDIVYKAYVTALSVVLLLIIHIDTAERLKRFFVFQGHIRLQIGTTGCITFNEQQMNLFVIS